MLDSCRTVEKFATICYHKWETCKASDGQKNFEKCEQKNDLIGECKKVTSKD